MLSVPEISRWRAARRNPFPTAPAPCKHGVVKPDRDGKHLPIRAERIKMDEKGVGGGCVLYAINEFSKCGRRGEAAGDHALDTVKVGRGRLRRWLPRDRDAIGADVNEEPFRCITRRLGMDQDLKVAGALRWSQCHRASQLSDKFFGEPWSLRPAMPLWRRSGPAVRLLHPRRCRARAPASAHFLGGRDHGETTRCWGSACCGTATHWSSDERRKVAAFSRKLVTEAPAAKSGTTIESAPS